MGPSFERNSHLVVVCYEETRSRECREALNIRQVFGSIAVIWTELKSIVRKGSDQILKEDQNLRSRKSGCRWHPNPARPERLGAQPRTLRCNSLPAPSDEKARACCRGSGSNPPLRRDCPQRRRGLPEARRPRRRATRLATGVWCDDGALRSLHKHARCQRSCVLRTLCTYHEMTILGKGRGVGRSGRRASMREFPQPLGHGAALKEHLHLALGKAYPLAVP